MNYVKNNQSELTSLIQSKYIINILFDLANIREINVKISDLIYNQSQCMTFAKSIIMFVTSIISANNSNKLQRYYFTVISFNISANIKIFFIKYFFFSSSQKVKVKIFSSRQNKNLETLFKK